MVAYGVFHLFVISNGICFQQIASSTFSNGKVIYDSKAELWRLAVDELLHKLTNLAISYVGYAKDLLIVIRDRCNRTLCDFSQSALGEVARCCRRVGLSHRHGKVVKFLGITLDSKLHLWNKVQQSHQSTYGMQTSSIGDSPPKLCSRCTI